jgi:hypothetical protein
MANEIRITENITITNAPFKEVLAPSSQVTHDIPTGYIGGGAPGALEIGTSEEDISFGDYSPGFVWIQNLSTTAYVRIGPKNGSNVLQPFIRILPGKTVRLYLDENITMRAVAVGAAAQISIRGYPGYTTSTTTTTT